MDEKEAIARLRDHFSVHDDGRPTPKLNEAVGIVIKATEKQISKKPQPINYEKYIDVIENAKFLRGAYWCPNCKHTVRSGTYCDDCGQKLDWSDV